LNNPELCLRLVRGYSKGNFRDNTEQINERIQHIAGYRCFQERLRKKRLFIWGDIRSYRVKKKQVKNRQNLFYDISKNDLAG
jgi:hypothetical protein